MGEAVLVVDATGRRRTTQDELFGDEFVQCCRRSLSHVVAELLDLDGFDGIEQINGRLFDVDGTLVGLSDTLSGARLLDLRREALEVGRDPKDVEEFIVIARRVERGAPALIARLGDAWFPSIRLVQMRALKLSDGGAVIEAELALNLAMGAAGCDEQLDALDAPSLADLLDRFERDAGFAPLHVIGPNGDVHLDVLELEATPHVDPVSLRRRLHRFADYVVSSGVGSMPVELGEILGLCDSLLDLETSEMSHRELRVMRGAIEYVLAVGDRIDDGRAVHGLVDDLLVIRAAHDALSPSTGRARNTGGIRPAPVRVQEVPR